MDTVVFYINIDFNAYAEQGWRVIGCATADFPSFGGPRQELIALLEREK